MSIFTKFNFLLYFYIRSCQHNNGAPCHTLFSVEERVKRRMEMVSMTSKEQSLILLGKISCTINMSPMTCNSKRAGVQMERTRQRTAYMMESHVICRETFKFLHAISQDRLTSIIKLYKENGLVPKEKKSGGRSNQRSAYSYEDIKRSVAFITNYSEDHALVLPERVPGFRRESVKLLPSSETKIKVFKAYSSAMVKSNYRATAGIQDGGE